MKTCSCGNKFKFIPENAQETAEGFWWNCECTSTIFMNRKRLCHCSDCVDDEKRSCQFDCGGCEGCDKIMMDEMEIDKDVAYYSGRASGRF